MSKSRAECRPNVQIFRAREETGRYSEYTQAEGCAYCIQYSEQNRAPGNREEAGSVPGGRATEASEQIRAPGNSRVHASKIRESRGGGRESRGCGRESRWKGSYPTEAQKTGGRAAADGRRRRKLEAEQVRTAPRQVRTCGDAGPWQGWPAGGLEQRSSQAASRARGSSAAFSLFLSLRPHLR
jgi:hypothetical protein